MPAFSLIKSISKITFKVHRETHILNYAIDKSGSTAYSTEHNSIDCQPSCRTYILGTFTPDGDYAYLKFHCRSSTTGSTCSSHHKPLHIDQPINTMLTPINTFKLCLQGQRNIQSNITHDVHIFNFTGLWTSFSHVYQQRIVLILSSCQMKVPITEYQKPITT